jgi:hypothetical protein
MSERSETLQLRDRHEDYSSTASLDAALQPVKPPVLRRSTICWMSVLWIGLVLWGTLGPMGLGKKPWIAPIEDWRWIPPVVPLSHASYNDIFTNVLVYLPVGVALGLLMRRRGGFWPGELTVAMILAISLSYTTEFLQQFMPARTFDRVDLFVDSAAALLGCLLAPRAQRGIRRAHGHLYANQRRHPWLMSAWIMTGITFVLMSMPWDFYWPSLEINYRRSLDLLDIRRFGTFLVLGFFVAMAMIERHGRVSSAYGEAIKRIFICGVYFEAMQIFIHSHACGLLDISTAFFGGLAGIGAARWLTGTTLLRGDLPSHTRRLLASIVLLVLIGAYVVFGVAEGLRHATPQIGTPPLWLPFQMQFLESFDRAMIDIFENLFIYGTVTMICLYLTMGAGRLLSFVVLFGMIGIVQLFRGALEQRGFDLTPFVTAIVAWLTILRCWKSFVPHVRRPATANTHEYST